MLIFAWMPVEHRGESLVALLATALSVVYFVQKQKLEELEVFERLFTRFNKRYEKLHDDLRDNPTDDKLSRYFNLCAEEFLFFSEGLIHPIAWRAWCLGMQSYFQKEQMQ